MAMLCMKPADVRCNDARRAELLRWLLDNQPTIDLSAANACLQTPAHCAIKSGSLEVLEVRDPSSLSRLLRWLLDNPP